MSMKDVNRRTGEVVDAAMRVHSRVGPGLLESAYSACLAHELRKRGFSIQTQVGIPLVYDEVRIDLGYRVDLVVDDLVLVELKAVSKVLPVHRAQLLSY